MALKFRTSFYALVPGWQSSGEGEALLWSLGRLKDAFVLWSKQALLSHFPSKAGPSSNAVTGQERGVIKGRNETEAHYADRLAHFRYPRGHRVRGNPYAALNEIAEYWGGVRCYIVSELRSITMRGCTGIYEVDAPVYERDAELTAYDYQEWFSIDGADSDANPHRFLVHISPVPQHPEVQTSPPIGDDTLWGGAIGTPGYVIGMVGWTPADTAAMRKLFYDGTNGTWAPAFTLPMWLVVQLTDWTAWTSPLQPVPSDHWAQWSYVDGTVRRPARHADYRFIALDPSVQGYVGSPVWTAEFELPDGTEYAGDPTNWPATITLPAGGTYVGNPNNWPTRINLVDDGSEAR